MNLIKHLRCNRQVVFDTGHFDAWCVYVVEADGSRNAPFDIDYFKDLKRLSAYYL